jgi:hypothetical protein
MLKRSTVLALGFAALAATWGSAPVTAGIYDNALNPNALSKNALSPNGLNSTTLQAVRLALPDGSEVTFR